MQVSWQPGKLLGLVTEVSKTLNIWLNYFAVKKYAQERIAPLVSKMDEDSFMDQEVIKSLFEHGVCNWYNCQLTVLLQLLQLFFYS